MRRNPGLFFFGGPEMGKARRWEIAICERGTVHVHYGTGSLHILAEDFHRLARDIQEVAVQMEIESVSASQQDADRKRQLQ
jgi:hypothetical protein